MSSSAARRVALAVSAVALAAAPLRAQAPALPEADGSILEPARMAFLTTLQIRGKTLTINQTRTLERIRRDGRELWAVVEESKTSRGTGVDSVLLDRDRLVPVRRHATGQGDIQLTYTPDSISGSLSFGQSRTDVGVGLQAPVYAGGPGLETALAGLPLEKGYSATIRTFDPQQQEVRTRKLEVTGTETVEVPAGEFDVFVVKATPSGGAGTTATFWVRRSSPHHVVRSERQLSPSSGGGTATKVLTAFSSPPREPSGEASGSASDSTSRQPGTTASGGAEAG